MSNVIPFPERPTQNLQSKRQRQEAISNVRALAEAVDDLLNDPMCDFTHDLTDHLLQKVNQVIEEGWLE